MNALHCIRLHGPWDCEPLCRTRRAPDGSIEETSGNLPAGGRIRLPADWGVLLGHDFYGRVRFVRRFGRPTNLGEDERVWLHLTDVRGAAVVDLNGVRLGALPADSRRARYDVTALLGSRNDLQIDVDFPAARFAAGESDTPTRSPPRGIVGEVRLEIAATGDGR